MKNTFSYLGGFVAALNLVWFAWRVWAHRVKPQNIASWLMWTVIDVVILVCTIAAHKSPWLALAYVVGAATVTFALFARGTWEWSWPETTCAVGAVISLYVWQTWSADFGVLAGVLALAIAGIPIFIEMVQVPIRGTWPVWALTVVAGVLTLFGSDWTLGGTALAWGGVIFNGALTLVVLRK